MKALIALLAALLTFSVCATVDTLPFASVQQEQQYRHLTASLRCPKCQNTSIADSSAQIAADMRLRVYQLLREGHSPQQITDYMVARYGNFVTYQPPLTAATLILWAGPALFVLLGVLMIFMRGRKRPSAVVLDDAEQQRLATLLSPGRKP